MPFVNVDTNINLPENEMKAFIDETIDLVSDVLGKSKEYMAAVVNVHENMGFGRAGERGALITIRSIGFGDKGKELNLKVSEMAAKALKVDISAINVHMLDMPANTVGKAGKLFG